MSEGLQTNGQSLLQPRDSDSTEKSGSYRKRGSQACESCRIGKRRCDGAKPICATCARRRARISCVYEKGESKRAATLKQIELLQKRIVELEGARSKEPSQPPDSPTVLPQQRSLWSETVLSPPDSESQHAVVSDRVWTGQQHRFLTSPQSSQDVCQGIDNSAELGVRFRDEPDISGSCVDGMGAVVSDEINNREIGPGGTYFGMSSTVNFVSQVRKILSQSNGTLSQGEIMGGSISGAPSWRRGGSKRRFEEYVVPPRNEADAILEIFWVRIHSLYPFLDRGNFEEAYSDIWSSDTTTHPTSIASEDPANYQSRYRHRQDSKDQIPPSRHFHILLNVMFALGCRCNDSETLVRQVQRGEMFWNRCKELLEMDFDLFNRPCLELVQALLFMGVYLQSTAELTGACWNIVGVAIRLAQALGLHASFSLRAGKEYQVGSRLSKEGKTHSLRMRTWAGCVLMDRTLATTYGRPALISTRAAAQIRLPLEEPMATTHALGNSNSLPFLMHLLKLQNLLMDIVIHFYDDDNDGADGVGSSSLQHGVEMTLFKAQPLIRRLEAGIFHDLIKLEENLVSWERGLPPSLRIPPTIELITHFKDSQPLERQAVILRARYLYGHILMFRPLLLYAIASSKDPTPDGREPETLLSALIQALLAKGRKLCINSAIELVLLIDWVRRNRNEALPEPWYTIFYLYTCGMVLLIHRKSAPGEDNINLAWEQCIGALQTYSTTSRTAMRCVKLLELSESSSYSLPNFPGGPQHVSQTGALAPSLSQPRTDDHLDLHTIIAGDEPMPDFSFQEMQEGYWNGFPAVSMDDQIDLAWLSTAPFQLGFDEDGGVLW